jgi:hypothetical protein
MTHTRQRFISFYQNAVLIDISLMGDYELRDGTDLLEFISFYCTRTKKSDLPLPPTARVGLGTKFKCFLFVSSGRGKLRKGERSCEFATTSLIITFDKV